MNDLVRWRSLISQISHICETIADPSVLNEILLYVEDKKTASELADQPTRELNDQSKIRQHHLRLVTK